MLKLKKILALHELHVNPLALKNNLGDSYLLELNPVFYRIRKSVLDLGFQFSSARFHDYDVLALTQLPRLLRAKTIPYVDNVRCLKEIEAVAPNHFYWNEIPPLRANYLLHESAHALARSVTQRFFKKKKFKNKIQSEKIHATVILLEEAFANASESISSLFATSELHQEFLFKNSYIIEKNSDRLQLALALDALGWHPVFQTLVLSFLLANFNQTIHAKRSFEYLLVQVAPSANRKEAALLKKVFRIGFDLDPEFTNLTHAFCLRLAGIKANFAALMQFDFFTFAEKEPFFYACLQELSARLKPEEAKS